MKYLKIAGVAIIFMSASGSAVLAAESTESIIFGAEIEEACSIVIDNQGAFGVSGDQKSLDSTLAGGTTAQAQITTNSLLTQVSVESPDTFSTSPTDAELGTTFSTSYNFDGLLGTTTTRDGDTETTLLLGTSNINIDAKAERADSPFEAGTYEYIATLKCVTN